MEHQGFVREGIDAFDPFQENSLIELCKAEYLGGKVVEQLLRDLSAPQLGSSRNVAFRRYIACSCDRTPCR